MQDEEFKEVFEEENAFKNAQQSRNRYEGITDISLPYILDGVHTRHVYTSASSGSFQSPWYGERFSSEKYRTKVSYEISIQPQSTGSASKLVFEFLVDIMKTASGDEKIEIWSSFSDFEILTFSGNVSLIRKYDIGETVRVHHTRRICQITDEPKTIIGFSMKWFLEDLNGDPFVFCYPWNANFI